LEKEWLYMEINGIDVNTKLRDIPNLGILLDYPFVRDEMTWGEYLEEKEYYGKHYKEHWLGTYKPLWKQREERA
jgi:hypothetical protein